MRSDFAVVRPAARRWFVLLAALLATAGCTYQGSGIDNPLTRRSSWLSFVAGDDIRAACGPGGADRYRLVYNGFWQEQVRIYELGLGQPAELSQRVLGRPDLSRISADDLLAPWRGTTATGLLAPGAYDRLVAALAVVSDAPPVGLRLPSDGFYWTAVACRGGRFFHNAWLYPSERFAALPFPPLLAAFDPTGIPFSAPDPFAYIGQYDERQLMVERWYIEVGTESFSGPG